MIRIAPWLQTNWDWRAAGNFICGGTGAGILIAAAVAHEPGNAYRLLAAIGMAFIATGLFSVWLEIGRPLRAINVFRQPQLSWMSRESLVAPILFASGIAAAWFGGGAFSWIAAVLAAGFLYCQARMLRAARGIPAWRNPRIVPLMLLTGLCEGVGLILMIAAIPGGPASSRLMQGILIVLVVGRGLAWRAYLARLERDGVPARAFDVMRSMQMPMSLVGIWGPLLLLLIASSFSAMAWIAAIAGLCALGSGWLLKFILITRAAYNQGFALPRLPVRGAGEPGPAYRPGWH
ncbi:MAG: dimethyl sulfoxide reductase anchor subunit [Betaproteobacteria bacterium]|nr:dimethyl sulfoxide reductase anchor subunit [Betaproteobacteria bacterium]